MRSTGYPKCKVRKPSRNAVKLAVSAGSVLIASPNAMPCRLRQGVQLTRAYPFLREVSVLRRSRTIGFPCRPNFPDVLCYHRFVVEAEWLLSNNRFGAMTSLPLPDSGLFRWHIIS